MLSLIDSSGLYSMLLFDFSALVYYLNALFQSITFSLFWLLVYFSRQHDIIRAEQQAFCYLEKAVDQVAVLLRYMLRL